MIFVTLEKIEIVFLSQNSVPSVTENWSMSSQDDLYKPLKVGMKFQLKHETSHTVLHCSVKMLPSMEMISTRYTDVVAGHFRWDGDRESPV